MTEPPNSPPKRARLEINVSQDVSAAIDDLAKDRRVSREHLLREAIVLLLEDHCLPVPPSLRQQLASFPSSVRHSKDRRRAPASTMGDG